MTKPAPTDAASSTIYLLVVECSCGFIRTDAQTEAGALAIAKVHALEHPSEVRVKSKARPVVVAAPPARKPSQRALTAALYLLTAMGGLTDREVR